MPKKYKYKIGDWVEFKKHIKVNSGSGERYVYEIGTHRSIRGQICGAVTRYIGEIKVEEWDYHINSATLIKRKAVILYQVKQGMTNVPYEVREEDIQLIESLGFSILGKLPWRYVPYEKFHKQLARENALSQPRDSKGRFIRGYIVRHIPKAVGE